MTDVPYSIIDFFNSYPDAAEVYEVSEQLFHANAKEAAEARANFYGLEVKTYFPPAPEGGSTALEGVLEIETSVEMEIKTQKSKAKK